MKREPARAWKCVAGCSALTDHAGDICRECYAAKRERMAIVEWLRRDASQWSQSANNVADAFADAIERNEHAPGKGGEG